MICVDHYAILEVSIGVDLDTLKQQYRKLAKQYHPDINKSPGADIRFRQINDSYNFLLKNSIPPPPLPRVERPKQSQTFFRILGGGNHFDVLIPPNMIDKDTRFVFMWNDGEYSIFFSEEKTLPLVLDCKFGNNTVRLTIKSEKYYGS